MKRALIAVVLLTGCAALPPCPPVRGTTMQTDSGAVFAVLDPDDIAVLRATLRGAATGTCRIVLQQ